MSYPALVELTPAWESLLFLLEALVFIAAILAGICVFKVCLCSVVTASEWE